MFLLAGDQDHPEVKGIVGHCKGENFVVKNSEELVDLLNFYPELCEKPLAVAAQTTFHAGEMCIRDRALIVYRIRSESQGKGDRL